MNTNKLDIAQLLLNAQQSARLEQTIQQLKETSAKQEQQLLWLKQEQESSAAKRRVVQELRQAIYEIRQQVEDARPELSTFDQHLRLLFLADHSKGFDVTGLDTLSDKEYYAQTIKLIATKAKELIDGLDEGVRQDFQSLSELVAKTMTFVRSLQGSARPTHQKIQEMENDLQRIEDLASRLSDTGLDITGAMEKVEGMATNFIPCYRMMEFFAKAVCSLAQADNSVDAIELQVIEELGILDLPQINRVDFINWIRQPITVDLLPECPRGLKTLFPDGPKEVLTSLCRVALADGEVTPAENSVLVEVGKLIGLNEVEVQRTLEKTSANPALTTLDKSKFVKSIIERATARQLSCFRFRRGSPAVELGKFGKPLDANAGSHWCAYEGNFLWGITAVRLKIEQ